MAVLKLLDSSTTKKDLLSSGRLLNLANSPPAPATQKSDSTTKLMKDAAPLPHSKK